jgi:hypothetical protein
MPAGVGLQQRLPGAGRIRVRSVRRRTRQPPVVRRRAAVVLDVQHQKRVDVGMEVEPFLRHRWLPGRASLTYMAHLVSDGGPVQTAP